MPFREKKAQILLKNSFFLFSEAFPMFSSRKESKEILLCMWKARPTQPTLDIVGQGLELPLKWPEDKAGGLPTLSSLNQVYNPIPTIVLNVSSKDSHTLHLQSARRDQIKKEMTRNKRSSSCTFFLCKNASLPRKGNTVNY